MVCSTTDPGWAPIMMLAGAIVLDMGSALSHGAIVARELGIPCVANTTNATTTIIDGMTITVDGSAGTVESRPSASNIDDGS
jgi:phosphoenolpyruvate synthase/pyruvate phosphate dikinase